MGPIASSPTLIKLQNVWMDIYRSYKKLWPISTLQTSPYFTKITASAFAYLEMMKYYHSVPRLYNNQRLFFFCHFLTVWKLKWKRVLSNHWKHVRIRHRQMSLKVWSTQCLKKLPATQEGLPEHGLHHHSPWRWLAHLLLLVDSCLISRNFVLPQARRNVR